MVPDIAQSTHGIRNILVDNRNVPTRPHMVLGMFLLAFPVYTNIAGYLQKNANGPMNTMVLRERDKHINQIRQARITNIKLLTSLKGLKKSSES